MRLSVNLVIVCGFVAACEGNGNGVASVSDQIAALNASAPMMINEETRFEQASLTDSDITFHYTMISMLHSEYNFESLETEFAPQQIESICAIYVPLGFFELGYEITYSYSDKAGQHVIDVVANEAVCSS